MKKSYLSGAAFLAMGILIAKIIGALYRIPLTNILGAEGMGIYQLIYPIYALLLAVSSGSLPVAVSVLVGAKTASGDKEGARATLRAAWRVLLWVGLGVSVALALLSGVIGNLQGNPLTRSGYCAVAPAIFFVAGIAVLRGWFQGLGDMKPTAASQIVENAARLVFGLGFAVLLKGRGIAAQAAGALAGVSVSEALTLVVLMIRFRRSGERLSGRRGGDAGKGVLRDLSQTALPVMIGGIVFPLTQMIDSFLVVNLLAPSVGVAAATAQYGLFTGPVNSLVNLPVVIGLSLGVAVVPGLSGEMQRHNLEGIRAKCRSALKIALIVGVPSAIAYLILADKALSFLYPVLSVAERRTAAVLLRVGALSVVLMSASQIFASILQGLSRPVAALKNAAFGGGCKLIAGLILLPTVGIVGVAAATLVGFALTLLLDWYDVRLLIGKTGGNFLQNAGVIVLCGVIMGAVIGAINLIPRDWALFVAMAAGSAVYLGTMLISGVLDRDELASLPLGEKLLAWRDRSRR